MTVEAALFSRALSPLHAAISLGRPALIVPGPVTSSMSGCHDALRQYPQARRATCAADIIAELDAAERSDNGRDDDGKGKE